MIAALEHRGYRFLLASQVLSLLGTGVMTVALALMAVRIAGPEKAGLILGLLFSVKMVIYVVGAPLLEVALARFPVGRVLVALDVARTALVMILPFAAGLAVLAPVMAAFYLCAAGYTPTYQAVLPRLLGRGDAYVSALSLSRLAYTTEAMASPAIAGLLLGVLAGPQLFWLAALFLSASALCVLLAAPPDRDADVKPARLRRRLTKGFVVHWHTPRLRALVLAQLAMAVVVAWVLVNTAGWAALAPGDGAQRFAVLMTFYGVGGAAGAVLAGRLTLRIEVRQVMLGGLFTLAALALLPGIVPLAPGIAVLFWAGIGAAASLVTTPGGLLVARSAAEADRPALFAAQFSLSHLAWLIAYPLAAVLGAAIGLAPALTVLAVLGGILSLAAWRIWPRDDALQRRHIHRNLPRGHPHLRDHGGALAHCHEFHIDTEHPHWSMGPMRDTADGGQR